MDIANSMIRKIWILWLQGFETAPYLVKECLHSWNAHNGDSWDIIQLSQDNIHQFVDLNSIYKDLYKKTTTKAGLSEIIRMELLTAYGGLWVDATTFCNRPLDGWLSDYIRSGFFAFKLDVDRLLSSWFLYADRSNYIINKWQDKVHEYVHSHNVIGAQKDHVSLLEWDRGIPHDHYFWLHYLFGDLCKHDREFNSQWQNVPKISAHELHYIQHDGMLRPITDEIKATISSRQHPVYKLTYRYQHPPPKNSVLEYLFLTGIKNNPLR